MKSFDTNIVLRFLLNDIPSQSEKVRRLFASPPFYVSDVVISEAVFVLENSMEFDRRTIAHLLRGLIAIPGLECRDHLLPQVVDLYEQKRSLSFVDCYSAVEAGVFGAKLYTFDKKLINQGGPHVLSPQ